MAQTSPARPAITAVAASLVAGLALWLSRASFDVAGTAEAPLRVAMLPALPELAGLIVLSLLGAAGIASLLRSPRQGTDGRPFWEPVVSDVLSPSFALLFLVLPYLPWLPDMLPALRLFAGPGRALVWLVVIGQMLWLFLPELMKRRQMTLVEPAGPFAGSLVVFAASLAVYLWAANTVTGAPSAWPVSVAAAAVAALVWVAAFAVSRSKGAATFAWAGVCLGAPFVLNSPVLVQAPAQDLLRALRQLPTATFTSLGSGAPGLLFDQEFGLLAHAPVLLPALAGLVAMARDRSLRALAITSTVAALSLIALGGSVAPWWNESMMPGRGLILALPLLAPPLAWLYARTGEQGLPRAGLRILLLSGLGVTLTFLLATEGAALPPEGDGSSSLLQWMSPAWQLWNLAPSYVTGTPLAAVGPTALWLAALAVVALLFSRMRASRMGSALSATTIVLLTATCTASIGAELPLGRARPRSDTEWRGLLPLLETFNTVTHPIAVRYDPMSVVAPAELPPLFSLSAVTGERRVRQPLRVLLSARFRLPAGQYELDVTASELAGTVQDATINLQIGREGAAIERWAFTALPGAHAQYRFTVPLDAEFVGFRASREVERTVAHLRVRPLQVVDQSRRFATPPIRSSAVFGAVKVFFHHPSASAEPTGFWVRGRDSAQFTILKPGKSDTGVTLAVHSGPRPNTLALATRRWSELVDLVPGVTREIVVPADPADAFLRVSIISTDGFVPAEANPESRDRRLLGAWVAFVPKQP